MTWLSGGLCSAITPLALACGVAMTPLAASAQCNFYTAAPGPNNFVAGTTDLGVNGDEVIANLALPFPVTLYGVSYNDVNVSSNGFLEFGGTRQAFGSGCLPDSRFFVPMIFAHWDDLDTGSGGVFTTLSGSPGSQMFAIEWQGTSYSSGAGLVFEVIFYENQTYFDIIQNSTDSGDFATVGVQQAFNGPSTEYLCHTSGLTGGLAVRFSCASFTNPGSCCTGSVCTIVEQGTCPGGSDFTLGGVCMPSPCPPAPANDTCAGAVNLNAQTLPYHHTQSWTLASDDLVGDTLYVQGVWFTYTASQAGRLHYSDATNALLADAPLLVVTSECGGEQFASQASRSFRPTESLVLQPGDTVNICVNRGVNGSSTLTGASYDLTFDFTPIAVPSNDTCAGAFDLNSVTLPYTAAVDNYLATADSVDLGGLMGTRNHGVWFTYTAATRGYLKLEEVGQQSVQWAFAPDCGTTPLSLGGELIPRYALVEAGQAVKILVDGQDGSSALLRPRFTFTPVSAATPANDTCATAVDLNALTLPYRPLIDVGAAGEDDSSCLGVHHGVWYTFTPPWSGYLAINEYGPQAVKWAVGYVDCSTPTCVNGGDPSSSAFLSINPGVRVPVNIGEPVNLLVGTTSTSAPANPLQLNFVPTPDDCDLDFAQPVPVPGSITADMTFARSTPGGVPSSCEMPGAQDLWYSVTIPSTGSYTVRATPIEPWYARLEVSLYSGGCPDLGGALVACSARQPLIGAVSNAVVSVQQTLTPGTYIVRVAVSSDTFDALFTRFTLEVGAACPADFNGVNGVTVQDIFDFLTAWLAGSPSADFNHVNGVTVQDIFDFLTAWLAGC